MIILHHSFKETGFSIFSITDPSVLQQWSGPEIMPRALLFSLCPLWFRWTFSSLSMTSWISLFSTVSTATYSQYLLPWLRHNSLKTLMCGKGWVLVAAEWHKHIYHANKPFCTSFYDYTLSYEIHVIFSLLILLLVNFVKILFSSFSTLCSWLI